MRIDAARGVVPFVGRIRRLLGSDTEERTEWQGSYRAHRLRVCRSGWGRLTLVVDGVRRDRRLALPLRNRRIPLLAARLPGGGPEVEIAEVFVSGWAAPRVTVRIGGRTIAPGDR